MFIIMNIKRSCSRHRCVWSRRTRHYHTHLCEFSALLQLRTVYETTVLEAKKNVKVVQCLTTDAGSRRVRIGKTVRFGRWKRAIFDVQTGHVAAVSIWIMSGRNVRRESVWTCQFYDSTFGHNRTCTGERARVDVTTRGLVATPLARAAHVAVSGPAKPYRCP